MLIILTLLAFFKVFILLDENLKAEFFGSKWQAAFLSASILWGFAVMLSSET